MNQCWNKHIICYQSLEHVENQPVPNTKIPRILYKAIFYLLGTKQTNKGSILDTVKASGNPTSGKILFPMSSAHCLPDSGKREKNENYGKAHWLEAMPYCTVPPTPSYLSTMMTMVVAILTTPCMLACITARLLQFILPLVKQNGMSAEPAVN